jgi:hypothetical protein
MVLDMTFSTGHPKVAIAQHGQCAGFSFVRTVALSGCVGLLLASVPVIPVDQAQARSDMQIMKEFCKRNGSVIEDSRQNKDGKLI